MKKFIVVLLLTLTSCCVETQDVENKQRIEMVEKSYINGYRYFIISIDGHEYITNTNGGITHLESCQCKEEKFNSNTYESDW